jgi:adenylate cyclase
LIIPVWIPPRKRSLFGSRRPAKPQLTASRQGRFQFSLDVFCRPRAPCGILPTRATILERSEEMSTECNGQLVPVGGGDPIPLIRPALSIGRRQSCDICLGFANVSGTHCELAFKEGRWIIHDLGSTNGTKVNGMRVGRKVLFPKDTVSIANHRYTIEYEPLRLNRFVEESLDDEEEILKQPLLERAGLVRPQRGDNHRASGHSRRDTSGADSSEPLWNNWKAHPDEAREPHQETVDDDRSKRC